MLLFVCLNLDLNKLNISVCSRSFNAISFLFVDFFLFCCVSLQAKKSQPLIHGGSSTDYKGNIPSFKHFGFLVMIVPMLEALKAGELCIWLRDAVYLLMCVCLLFVLCVIV